MNTGIVGLYAALLLAAAAVPVQADPITVTGGSYQSPSGQFTLIGDGFSLTAFDDFPFLPCQPCSPSRNALIPLAIHLTESPFSTGFPGTFNGISYPATYLNGSLTFTAPTLQSNMLSPTNLTLAAPFSMTGSLVGFSSLAAEQAFFDRGTTTDAIVNDTFNGLGTVTARFTVNPMLPFGSLFDPQAVTYEFDSQPTPSPTPEPASLFLIGTGVVSLVWRLRRVR